MSKGRDSSWPQSKKGLAHHPACNPIQKAVLYSNYLEAILSSSYLMASRRYKVKSNIFHLLVGFIKGIGGESFFEDVFPETCKTHLNK